jgi:hypothetical protein
MSFNPDLQEFAARLREFIELSHLPGLGKQKLPPLRIFGKAGAGTVLAAADRFEELALQLFHLQFTHNLAYRKFCQGRGASPANVASWTDIPAVPTSAFKELELSCLPREDRTAVFYSSGTTAQEPSRHFHNRDSLAIYDASLLAWFGSSVLQRLATADWRLVILTPSPAQAPHSSLVHMFEMIRSRFTWKKSDYFGRVSDDGSWNLGLESLAAELVGITTGVKPAFLLGTAFSFVQLLDYLSEHSLNFELPPGSLALETGGYKGRSRSLPKAELYRLITLRLGIPPTHIVSEYGMSELSSQAYDLATEGRAAQRVFHFPPWARVQVVSPETGNAVEDGETGLIRVFDLANVFSTMAIQTEDLGVRRAGGFELVGRARAAEPRGCSLMAV